MKYHQKINRKNLIEQYLKYRTKRKMIRQEMAELDLSVKRTFYDTYTCKLSENIPSQVYYILRLKELKKGFHYALLKEPDPMQN